MFKVSLSVAQLCKGYMCIACGQRFAKNKGKCIALCQRCARTKRLDIVMPEHDKRYDRDVDVFGTNFEYDRKPGKIGSVRL